LRDFRDAQDAVALFESQVGEFGYSLTDPRGDQGKNLSE
jgi:hypothetical protein